MENVISGVIHDFLKRFETHPPDEILQLFAITKKKEAIKICKELTIWHGDLAGIITGCELIGYDHFKGQSLNRESACMAPVRIAGYLA